MDTVYILMAYSDFRSSVQGVYATLELAEIVQSELESEIEPGDDLEYHVHEHEVVNE